MRNEYRRAPGLSGLHRRALVVLSLGFVSLGTALNGQSDTRADAPGRDRVELSYHLQAITRDSGGQYRMTGTLKGEWQGQAIVRFGFDEVSSGEAGKALIHSYWEVTADQPSASFKAQLSGTADVASGRTHLVGEITQGANKGRRVETRSQLLDLGPNGTLSDIDGTMIIDRK